MKTKILFVCSSGYPNPSSGGPTRIVHELLKNLDYSVYQPYFLSYDMYKKYSSKDEITGDQAKNIYQKRNFGYNLFLKNKLYRKIVTSNLYLNHYFKKRDKYFRKIVNNLPAYDIIHCHDTMSGFYFSGRKADKKILTIHSKGSYSSELKNNYNKIHYVNNNNFELLQRELSVINKFDIITFPSESAKKLFYYDLNINSLPDDKVKIIYNGINIQMINSIHPDDILAKFSINKKAFDLTLLNVAQHVKEKNIDLLIKTVKYLKDNYNIKILLINVGQGPLTGYFNNIVNQLALNDQIIFLGKIPNPDVIRLMKSIEVFVQASEKVVFDLSIIEALFCGCTIIASNNGGNREIITNNINGFLVDNNSVSDYSDKIISIINKPANSYRINLESITGFSIENMVNNYCKIYS